MKIEKEMLSLLQKLAELNPSIPFKYNVNSRLIVADVTNIRKTMTCNDIVKPEGDYVFHSTSYGKVKVSLETPTGDEEIAELSVDKCNLTESKRKNYDSYRNYHTGDTYEETIVDKLRNGNTAYNKNNRVKYYMTAEALKNIDSNPEMSSEQKKAIEELMKQVKATPNDESGKSLEGFLKQLPKNSTNIPENKIFEFNLLPFNQENITIPVDNDVESDQESKKIQPSPVNGNYSIEEYNKLLTNLVNNGLIPKPEPFNIKISDDEGTESKQQLSYNERKDVTSHMNVTPHTHEQYNYLLGALRKSGAYPKNSNSIKINLDGNGSRRAGIGFWAPYTFGTKTSVSNKSAKSAFDTEAPLDGSTTNIKPVFKAEVQHIKSLSEPIKIPNGKVNPVQTSSVTVKATSEATTNDKKTSFKDKLKKELNGLKRKTKYFFEKSTRPEGLPTFEEMTKEVFDAVKDNFKYVFKNGNGKGPKKIVKKPLKAKVKDSLTGAKRYLSYTFKKSEKVEKTETLGNKVNALFETIKKKVKYTFEKSEKVEKTETLGNKVNALFETIKKNVKYTFEKSEKVKKTETLGSKVNALFETIKKKVKYTFEKSEKVTIVGPGPKGIVKRSLRVKVKDSLVNTKKKRKMNNKPLSAKIKGLFNGAKNVLKYTFEKSEKVKPATTQKPGKPQTQPKPPVKPPVKPLTEEEKQKDLFYKTHKLTCMTEYSKLGELEKMFVDDATAECLYPEDSEFIQMLNERCVNKEQILNYYRVSTMSECKLNQNNILLLFVSLDEYERMFVEDAIAESITIDDSEYRQMLSERCVNKEGINKFMRAYKDYINKQKTLVKRYNGIVHEDMLIDRTTDTSKETRISVLTIDKLIKLSESHKNEMTEKELSKYEEGNLKKNELIDILERQDKKNIKTLKNGVCR